MQSPFALVFDLRLSHIVVLLLSKRNNTNMHLNDCILQNPYAFSILLAMISVDLIIMFSMLGMYCYT